MDIIRTLAEELGIRQNQAEAAVNLIDEGNTIPFIARYRKEKTGNLDDCPIGKAFPIRCFHAGYHNVPDAHT